MNQLKKGIPVDKVELESIEATPFFFSTNEKGYQEDSKRMWSAVLSSSSRLLAAQQMRPLAAFVVRTYISRAHPKARTVFSIHSALDQVLQGIEERIHKRQAKWDRNAEERAAKGTKDDGPYRNQDETVELALNLNVDPRKPGQNLRGSISLPHGTGKKVKIAVFTADPDAANASLDAGASYAGGQELIDQIVDGTVTLDSFDRTVASQDIMAYLANKLARTLGPRGLMPNIKVGTLVKSADGLVKAVGEQLAGQVQFRTDKAGIIHLGVGKGSFGREKLLDNIKAVMQEIYENKPEAYGKGKKPSKSGIFVLNGNLTATQGKGLRIDLRTIDPNSTYFMSRALESSS